MCCLLIACWALDYLRANRVQVVVFHGYRGEVGFDVESRRKDRSERVTELGEEPLGLWDSKADVRPWGHEVRVQTSDQIRKVSAHRANTG